MNVFGQQTPRCGPFEKTRHVLGSAIGSANHKMNVVRHDRASEDPQFQVSDGDTKSIGNYRYLFSVEGNRGILQLPFRFQTMRMVVFAAGQRFSRVDFCCAAEGF